MSRAVAIGERGLILGFKGAGIEVLPAEDTDGFKRVLGQISRQADVALVLVTETMAEAAPEALRDFRETSTAILTTIPTHKGSNHFSFKEMRRAIERSIGVDMLGKD